MDEMEATNDGVGDVLDECKQVLFRYDEDLVRLESAIGRGVSLGVWDSMDDLIVPHLQPLERAVVQELLGFEENSGDDGRSQEDRKVRNRIWIVLATLVDEAQALVAIAEIDFYAVLAVFGESGIVEAEAKDENENLGPEGDVEDADEDLDKDERSAMLMIGKALPFFQELNNFVKRCCTLCVNIIQQLASLYHSKQALYKAAFKSIRLMQVWESLGSILQVLITIDALIRSNARIVTSWVHYKVMVQGAFNDREKYCQVSMEEAASFEQMLLELDASVFAGTSFLNCIEQDFSGQDQVEIQNNKVFLDEMWSCLKQGLEEYTTEMKVASRESDALPTYEIETRLVSWAGLYALYNRLLAPTMAPDLSFFKEFWAVQKQVPIIVLYGQVLWFLDEFLGSNLSHIMKNIKSLSPKESGNHRREYTSKLDASLVSRVTAYVDDTCKWIVAIEEHLVEPRRHTEGNLPKIGSLGLEEGYSKVLLRAQSHRLLIYRGISLASRIKRLLSSTLSLHVSEQIPMSKRAVLGPVATMVELLKVIEGTFKRKSMAIAELAPIQLQNLVNASRNDIKVWQQRVATKLSASSSITSSVWSSSAPSQELEFGASALDVLEKTLSSSESFSRTRRSLLKLGIDIARGCLVQSTGICKQDEFLALEKRVCRIDALCEWQRRLRTICDTTLMYWHSELLGEILGNLYGSVSRSHRIPWILRGYADAQHMLRSSCHLSPAGRNELIERFKKVLLDALQQSIILPLCREVENTLRLHQYANSLDHMSDVTLPKGGHSNGTPHENRKDRSSPIRAIKLLLDVEPFPLLDEIIVIKTYVVAYLEREFYNMTVLALHDWNTYAEMRNIAKQNFGLDLAESRLPQGTLDMGLDILQIMRNIHVFVGLYNYNLNQQYFIERKADRGAKHLNTISIESISNSIHTHGSGIMNTCVNYTYQFLGKKFYIFSQFLFDEHIRSYLSRERRWFEKHCKTNQTVSSSKSILIEGNAKPDQHHYHYPFDRALAFNKDIRKLGQTKSGLSFLGQFRILITEIGNALGYVRMVRSAGMHWVADAIQFVPDLDHVPKFSEIIAKESDTPDEALAACTLLDGLIKDLSGKFAEETDYFKVLVDVFQRVMLDAQGTEHLQNFAMIVPSLCINFVEAMLLSKDQITRSHKGREAYFTDDGFAIGIAYILAILQQGPQFEALHWFQSVEEKYTKEIKDLKDTITKKQHEFSQTQAKQASLSRLSFYGKNKREEQTKQAGKAHEEEIAELNIQGRRLQATVREYRLVMFSLSGARTFFQSDDPFETRRQRNIEKN